MMETEHPFYPLGLSLPHYVPSTLSSIELVFAFAAGTLVIFAGTWILVNITNKKMATSEKVLCLWFALCTNLIPGISPELIDHLY